MKNIFGDKQIKIIRHVGDLNSVQLEDGATVKRQQEVFINADIGVVKCSPMDNHFVFRHVFQNRGWTLWCTCGSPAGVVGYEVYKRDASPQGQLLICLAHGQGGRHLDGSN